MEVRIPLTFRIYKGQQLIREETLTGNMFKIGKLESAHLRLDDESVSRLHAVIEVTAPNEIQIIDLGSSSGTIVNGQRVNKCQLRDGDELGLGNLRVTVHAGQAAEAAAPTQPRVAPAPPLPPMQPAMQAPMQPPAPPVMPAMAPPMAVPGFIPGVVPPAGMEMPQPAFQGYAAPMPDPTLDVQDGSRAIEVTAMFGDTVLGVRHLTNPAAGKISPFSAVMAGVGWALFLVGLIMVGAKQPGIAALLVPFGLIFGVYGSIRVKDERKSPHFSLGEDKNADIHLTHSAITAPFFPLVESTGSDYVVNFTQGMSGDVSVGAERMSLADLVQGGRARSTGEYPGAYSYPVPQSARIKVDIGESTFLVNAVAPARRVVRPFLAAIDWSVQSFTGLSFAVHALVLFLVFSVPPDARSLSLDMFNTDNRFVQILIKPPEQKQDEIPDWLKKKGPDEQGGKGQKHKGEEGKMGSKKSKNKTGLYGLKGPADTKDPHLAKRLAEEAAKDAGVLGLLKSASGSHIASIFGRDTALGTDAEDALGGLIGNQIGEAYGLGGLGLVGSGRGGGGTGEGTIGLGTLGTIGKGGGGGNGAGYGRGVGRLGGRTARAPRIVAGTAEVRGALDKEIIRRIIRRHIAEVKYCYSLELQSQPNLEGRVLIQFTISGTGQVVVSRVQSSTINNAKVENCIAQAVRRWLFPKPKGGGIVMVSYPFMLRAAGEGD